MASLMYLGLGQFTFTVLALESEAPFPIFPPVGVGVGLSILFGFDAILGMTVGAALLAQSIEAHWLNILGAALRTAITGFAVNALLRQLQVDLRLSRLRDVLLMLVGIFPATIALNALIACLFNMLLNTNGINWQKAWQTLFVADWVSALMITPFLVMVIPRLGQLNPTQVHQWLLAWWARPKFVLETLAWLGFTLGIVALQQYSISNVIFLESLPFMSIAWASVRFGVLTTVCTSFWISTAEISYVVQGKGIFLLQTQYETERALLLLQAFIAVIVILGLGLAAQTRERQILLSSVLREQKFDRILLDVAHRVSQSLNTQKIMQIAIDGIFETLEVDRVYLTQLMLDGSAVVTVERCRDGWASCLDTTFPAAAIKQVTHWYTTHGLEVLNDLDFPHNTDPIILAHCRQYQVRARVALPLFVDGKGYGLLAVHQCRSARIWTEHEIAFLEQILVPVGTALHQGLLFQRERNLVAELDQKVQERTEALQRSLLAQEQLNEGQTRLLHAVSHDLRTPIVGSLLVLRQMLKRDHGENAKMLEQLKESGERQLLMIQSLLEDYRAEDAMLRFRFKALDYGELVQAMLLTIAPIMRERQASITTNIAPHLPPIQADPLHLQRVLENLMTNALKHNAPGLQLQINAVLVQEGAMECIRCELIDDGVGIPKAMLQCLFARPYLRSSDGSNRDGLGLGLYLCNQIINAHGGKLYVEPVAQGAKFVFTLPTAVEPVAASALPLQT